jgi:Fe-S cluster assembly protein SufD
MAQEMDLQTKQNSWPDNFQSFKATLNGHAREPFQSLREKAFKLFSEKGFPSTKIEDWKYTNLSALSKTPFVASSAKISLSPQWLEKHFIIPEQSFRLVFVDGEFAKALSTLGQVEGVNITTVADLVSNPKSDVTERNLFQESLSRSLETGDALNSLNTAFLKDGVVIRVASKVKLDKPLEILFVTSGAEEEVAIYPRVLVVAEKDSSVSVIESHFGVSEKSYFVNIQTNIVAKQRAQVEYTKLVLEGDKCTHLGRISIHQADDSNVKTNVFSLSGALVRNEVMPVLDGEHIESGLYGLSVLNGNEHVDNFTLIDHTKPNSHSDELYRGIYSGKSKGIFSGTIIVRQAAQKTNAIQSNNSLLLSEDATTNSRPQLKIWADDVKCTHGATVGQLDENALFYLRSRGIPKTQATQMLIRSFAGDVLAKVSNEDLRKYLEARFLEKLEKSENAPVAD